MNTTKLNSKYVQVSEINAHSNVYDLELNEEIIINGEKNIAENIKLGDTIIFVKYSSYYKKNIELNLEVKYVGYSQFPSSCFLGNCKIQTMLGLVPVNTLRVGDLVITPEGRVFPIKCILETQINSHIDMMVHPDGLVITGYHPVKINNNWCFPIGSDLFEKQNIWVDSVYSIGLEDGISLHVNGIEVAGLGHQVQDDPVLTHPYFGSDLVIRDIFNLNPKGYCVIVPEQIIRNNITTLVCGIIKK